MHAEMWHESGECLFHYSSQIIFAIAVWRHLSFDNPSSVYDQDYVVAKIVLQKVLVNHSQSSSIGTLCSIGHIQ